MPWHGSYPRDVGSKRATEASSLKMQIEQLSALREGALASAALLVGIVPWGVVAGVAMVSAGLTQAQAVAMSVLVFAGTAQLARPAAPHRKSTSLGDGRDGS